MDELFHELNLYLDPSVTVNMGNSAEQNTAALIASSMNSEYEDDWSTPPSSYRDSHTPLTHSSVSSNSADHKLGFVDNLINQQLIHEGSTIAMEVNGEEGFKGFSEESLRLLTFNEYEEIRNYTDLDLLRAAVPTVVNEMNASCQPDSVVVPINPEFKCNDITPTKRKPKKTPSKKKKLVPVASKQFQSGSTLSAMEVNEEGRLMGFNDGSPRILPKKKKKKKQVPAAAKQLQTNSFTQVCPPSTLVSPAVVAQSAMGDGSEITNGIPSKKKKPVPVASKQFQSGSTLSAMEVNEEGRSMGFNDGSPQILPCNPAEDNQECLSVLVESKNDMRVINSEIQEVNDCTRHQDVRAAECPKKDGNVLKTLNALPQIPPNSEISSSPGKKSSVLIPRKETPAINPDSKLTSKAPSYLTLFPMRCKEYPMVYSCNHCVGIFTSIRAGQLHDCVKKRRGRKAGTKLQQSYSGNYSDWTLV